MYANLLCIGLYIWELFIWATEMSDSSSYLLYLDTVFLCIFLTFSAYWVLVFIRRIHCYTKYKRGAARCMSDEESGYLNRQLYYHFETEIWRYFFLLIINLFESLSGILGYIASIIPHYAIKSHLFNKSAINFWLSECISYQRICRTES